MKKSIAFLIPVLAIFTTCKTQLGLIHTIESQSGSPIAVYTIDDISVTVEPFTEDTWIRIAQNNRFIDSSGSGRLPKIPFFLIVIENKGNVPVQIKDISIIYNSLHVPVYTKKEIKDYLSSPAYQYINVEELTTPHRIIEYTGDIKKIDFAHNSIPFTLPFIPSSETHFHIVAGKWIPVNERQFTVEITIKFPDTEKIVDCTFVRKEYRTKGKHFLFPGGRND